jgi:hypothetical protein
VPEVRRLLLMLSEPPDCAGFRLAWSTFRRRHQAVARRCHAARRTRQHPAPHGALTVQILGPAVPELTDACWARVASLLPPQKPRTSRPAHDHRTILSGMLWVARTGATWRDRPEQFGPWETVHSRYQRWRKAGIWQQILAALSQHDAPATP